MRSSLFADSFNLSSILIFPGCYLLRRNFFDQNKGSLTRIIHQEIFLLARRRGKISGGVPEYPEHDFSTSTRLTWKFRSTFTTPKFE